MIKTILKTSLFLFLFVGFVGCSESTDNDDNTDGTEELVDEEMDMQEPEEVEEESAFGSLDGLVGEWTVDAATAGIKMDLTFGEDGSFKQSMGPIQAAGTWTVVDDQTVNVVTQNTSEDGQTWKVADLTEDGVNITWNPGQAKEKTIPLTRVK